MVVNDHVIIAGTPLPREPAVYPTAPQRTQTASGGDCRTAEQNRIGAAMQRSRIQWKLGVIPNSSKTVALGWQATRPTIPKCQYLKPGI